MKIWGPLSDHAFLNAQFIASEILHKNRPRVETADSQAIERIDAVYGLIVQQLQEAKKSIVDVSSYETAMNQLLEKLPELISITLSTYNQYWPDQFVDEFSNGTALASEKDWPGGSAGLFSRIANFIQFVDFHFKKEVPDDVALESASLEFILSSSHEAQLHDMDICPGFGGSTEFDDERPEQAKVIIKVKPGVFDFDHFRYAPYWIAHEIICHGYQSTREPKKRAPVDADCEFTEGFVDAAVLHRINQWLDKERVTTNGFISTRDKPMCKEFCDAAISLNAKRRAMPNRVAPFRQNGWRLFEDLAVAFASRSSSVPNRDLAARLALLLNIETLGTEGRNHVIDALEVVASAPNAPVSSALLGGFRRFVHECDDSKTSGDDALVRLLSAIQHHLNLPHETTH